MEGYFHLVDPNPRECIVIIDNNIQSREVNSTNTLTMIEVEMYPVNHASRGEKLGEFMFEVITTSFILVTCLVPVIEPKKNLVVVVRELHPSTWLFNILKSHHSRSENIVWISEQFCDINRWAHHRRKELRGPENRARHLQKRKRCAQTRD